MMHYIIGGLRVYNREKETSLYTVIKSDIQDILYVLFYFTFYKAWWKNNVFCNLSKREYSFL